jgi:hypothetical protein
MSHVARVEVPGTFHLVEQRVRRDLRVPVEFHDRHLCLATLHGSLYKYGIQLCGYNILSDRVLLAVILPHPHAISLALMNADHNFIRRFNEIHHRVAPFWQNRHHCCPFANQVAWPVLRYVDMASVRTGDGKPFDPHALSSAAEHAGLVSQGLLTAPPARLPNPAGWRACLETPEDERFVLALELCLRTGKPFGPFPFVRKVEQACGRRARPACLKWPGLFVGAESTAARDVLSESVPARD